MAFEEKGIAPISSGFAHIVSGQWWTYKSLDDSLAVIEADGYFDALVARIGLSEIISVTDSTGNVELLEVDAINPTAPRIITKKFVGSGSIADGSVTLPKLATGISPSHIVKFADRRTANGGTPQELFTFTGAIVSDDVLIQVRTKGAGAAKIEQAFVTAPDTVEVDFDVATINDMIFFISILRAAV